jgi:peroxiredoxin Q/BCP
LRKAPKGTIRGVFVVDKAGKVLAAQPGGPAATVEVVKKLVGSDETSAIATTADNNKAKDEMKSTANGVNGSSDAKKEDVVAANDTDTAEKPDSEKADTS